jgi:PhnB protein
MNRSVAAGATITSPAQDYEYGYRQGAIKDPFGHIWMLEAKI